MNTMITTFWDIVALQNTIERGDAVLRRSAEPVASKAPVHPHG